MLQYLDRPLLQSAARGFHCTQYTAHTKQATIYFICHHPTNWLQ